MNELPFDDGALRTVTIPGARWLSQVQLWRPGAGATLHTGDVETAVVLLSGTFDLCANGTSWPARGARTTPLQGRPMAVFLPPKTEFAATNATAEGELLLIAARQPAAAPAAEGRAALSAKPLLPMAGSNKSFDPASGEWRQAETFPSAAESLPPRRVQRLPIGSAASEGHAELIVERVFAPDYKAATLCLDEVVLPHGSSLRLADVPTRPSCDELLLFVRSAAGDCVRWGPASEADSITLRADDGPCYVAIVYAGKR